MLNRRPSPARRRQRGDILLITMVFLLLCLLGLVGSMRDTVTNTALTGNNLARQRDTQVTDLATQSIRLQLQAINSNGIPMSQNPAALALPYYRDVIGVPATPPSATYWRSCLGNSDPTQRCGQITLTVGGSTLPYTALAVVQPAGRNDRYSLACEYGSGNLAADFYVVYVHIQEPNGATFVNTESVYQQCETV